MRESGVVLAIDLGLSRTGLARSDPERKLAFGLPTFENKPGRSLKEHLRTLHREVPLTGIVFGLPLHMDGRLGDLAARVRRLADWARADLGLPVALLDERLTTVAAMENLGVAPRKVRRDKGARDREAARIILQEFLEAGCPFTEAIP
jgi:putative holliday junction resolvase